MATQSDRVPVPDTKDKEKVKSIRQPSRDSLANDESWAEYAKVFPTAGKFANLIPQLLRRSLEFSALFYILGFIIHNMYLASFGIRDFRLQNPAYVGIGALFLFALLLPFPVTFFMLTYLIYLSDRWDIKDIRIALAIATYVFIAPLYILILEYGILFLLLTGGEIDFFEELMQGINGVPINFVSLQLLLLVVFNVIIVYRHYKSGPSKLLDPTSLFTYFIILLFVSFYLLQTWSTHFYPQISPALGGGGAPTARLFMADDADTNLFTESKIGLQANNLTTCDIPIIDEGEAYVTVLNEDQNAVKISKNLISNIVYLNYDDREAEIDSGCSSPTATPP